MYYQNVRGLRTKLVDLRLSIITLSSQYDIIVLTETWLDDTYNSAELGFANFSVYRCDRSSNTSLAARGGGVLVAVRDGLSSSVISVERTNIEQLFVYIANGPSRYIVAALYLPPGSPALLYQDHCQSVEYAASRHPRPNILLVGDYNLPHIDWRSDDINLPCRGT